MIRKNNSLTVLKATCLVFFIISIFSSRAYGQDIECKRLAENYKKARAPYERVANQYWSMVKQKKKLRYRKKRKKQSIKLSDYVLTHPPAYKGIKKPKCMITKKSVEKKRRQIGTVPDFLSAAKKEYNYVPRFVREKEFKIAYANEAVSLGLTAEQVIGVYALETGGLGPYNRQSGIFNVSQKCKLVRPRGLPASTALGYAQLLAANTVAVLKENGLGFAKILEFNSLLSSGQRKAELQAKAKMLRRMVKDIRQGILKYKRRNNWREFVAFAKTSKGFAIHALNLDADVGPRLQTHKLKKIVDVATRKGFKNISAAQLELMNLVGYGRGLEMMGPIAQKVPTSNFFSRGGYFRNPVAKNLTAKGLLNKLARIIKAKRKKCGSIEFQKAFKEVSKAQ